MNQAEKMHPDHSLISCRALSRYVDTARQVSEWDGICQACRSLDMAMVARGSASIFVEDVGL